MSYDYCPCTDDKPDPCPKCGATVEAGVCLYPIAPPPDYGVSLVVVKR